MELTGTWHGAARTAASVFVPFNCGATPDQAADALRGCLRVKPGSAQIEGIDMWQRSLPHIHAGGVKGG